ncbi:zinc ribbon domain-containing protein [Xanthomarina sp.]|uniref:zinc ribbon domain-containing protein n=1 Tax=Xanthomarina sp. TaxID=1931211 RepID=UPI002D03ED79|nr:zinc ribbon domain-containing protein [Xanthomarina sp.]HLV39132.1 zinc ribbon domain-containing protein [Xanthomarina sp.]
MEKVTCSNCGAENNNNAKYCSECGFTLPKIELKSIENMESKRTIEKPDNKKKIISMVFGIIAFGLSYFAVQHFFFEKPSLDKVLMNVANEINKSCPIIVDADTRLDNSIALPNNVFQYQYTLINFLKSEIDIEEVKNIIEPILINTIKSSPEMKIFRDNRTTLAYHYRDKNGVFVLEISIAPDQYE